MIVKVPIYVELIGKVDPDLLEDMVFALNEQFYQILRKRKIKMKFTLAGDIFDFSEAGADDVRILDREEALETLRSKR